VTVAVVVVQAVALAAMVGLLVAGAARRRGHEATEATRIIRTYAARAQVAFGIFAAANAVVQEGMSRYVMITVAVISVAIAALTLRRLASATTRS
jgi:hypothetical protein